MNQPVGWICWILMASLSRSLDFPSLFISLEHLLSFVHTSSTLPPHFYMPATAKSAFPFDADVLTNG